MPVDLITVPYDSALRGVRMGAGPAHFVANGAVERRRAVAGSVRETGVEAAPGFHAEIATAFDLARATAFAVRAARGHGGLPLVLAGNCVTAVGVLASLPAETTGIVWLDAHGDLNTPETTRSGFLDGMALSIALGRCWRAMSAGVQGFAPVAEENVLLVGARDLDPAEREYLERSRVHLLTPGEARGGDALADALDTLAGRVQRVYLHVDLDVHDPADGAANAFAAPGGLTAVEVQRVVREVAARVPIAAAALTAYDPEYDEDGRMLEIGLELMELIAELSAASGPSS
ncbi:MAG TPA: arginase family protein [Longimicrobium sp.]|jgi:arginase|nr:arginase family protein [Longimicrobium sp.]